MTVQQLIDELNKIEDKQLEVCTSSVDEVGDTCIDVVNNVDVQNALKYEDEYCMGIYDVDDASMSWRKTTPVKIVKIS